MKIFINGIGSISAQVFNPRSKENIFDDTKLHPMVCVEPEYTTFIPPMQLRRMSKVVRMGIATAKQALLDCQLEKPDVITLGTAYGCLADTENFLGKLLQQDESMLSPTAFIQSTHNTVSGQIALLLNCHGHNFTFVHRGYSFESSLQDAMMWIAEANNKDIHVLCGGIDEMTKDSLAIISRFGTFKKEHDHFYTRTEGTLAGEGANLFVLSNKQNTYSYAQLKDFCLCNKEDAEQELSRFLLRNNLHSNDIDTCLIGLNGDKRYDEDILNNIASLQQAQWINFKQWCGEYPTSGSFGMALGASFIANKSIPQEFYAENSPLKNLVPKNLLVYNHYKNQYHSFLLLTQL